MPGSDEEPWDLVIGQVTAPFGIKGGVRVRPETDFPERFHRLSQVCLELPSGGQMLAGVRTARIMPKGIVLMLSGCATRSDAEALRGAWVKVKHSMAVPLPEDRFWVHDILGLKVVTVEGEDLGEVIEVIRAPGNDVYVTRTTMIPAVRQVVRQVDLNGRRIVVSLPAGQEAPEKGGQ